MDWAEREKKPEEVQKEDHEYLNWSEGSGHGGREFKKGKELESMHEGSS